MKLQELFEGQVEKATTAADFIASYDLDKYAFTKDASDLTVTFLQGHGLDFKTLQYFPKRATKDFRVSDSNVESLEGGPEYVGGLCDVSKNNLKSLKFAPKEIMKMFDVSENPLQSLDCQVEYCETFVCNQTELKSLHNIHKAIKKCASMTFNGTKLQSHILGLFKIEGLDAVQLDRTQKPLESIINTFLKFPQPLMEIQETLINAGFEDFAQL
jgi:hypothetical protein